MSWRYAYRKLMEVLQDKDFIKQNKLENPNTPQDAILVALWHLHHDMQPVCSEWHQKRYGCSGNDNYKTLEEDLTKVFKTRGIDVNTISVLDGATKYNIEVIRNEK